MNTEKTETCEIMLKTETCDNENSYNKTLSEFQQRYIEYYMDKFQNIDSIIPAEYKEKYCILFGNTVLDSADTYEEIALKKKDEQYKHISIYIYCPKME
jgi:hypothetical protein